MVQFKFTLDSGPDAIGVGWKQRTGKCFEKTTIKQNKQAESAVIGWEYDPLYFGFCFIIILHSSDEFPITYAQSSTYP